MTTTSPSRESISTKEIDPMTDQPIAFFDHDTSTWRVPQKSLDGTHAELERVWPKAGIVRDGKLYERPTLLCRKVENREVMLPTPTYSMGVNARGWGLSKTGRRRYSAQVEANAWKFGRRPPIALLEWMMGFPDGHTDVSKKQEPQEMTMTISTLPTSTTLARISAARQALAEARTMGEVLDVRNKAAAIQTYMSQIGESLEVQNDAAFLKLAAERKAGELLAGMEKHNGDPMLHDATRLSDLGINRTQSSRWQLESKLPEDRFLELVEQCREEQTELTQSKLLKLANGAHVGESGENEWYTPAIYIEAARFVMDGIDLDPATSDEAQEIVQAETFYTIADDGLTQDWEGSVWMNPPYSRDLIERFCQKLVDSYRAGSVKSAIVLTNNATETGAGQLLLASCDAVCFHRGRIKFHGPKAQKNSPLQGQMICYFGKLATGFGEEFARFGSCR